VTDPLTHLELHRLRAAELRGRARARRLARENRRPYAFRTRIGWRLVEVGLRLASAPQVAVAR
jgi:hypothetical protein